jgi:hypothetical protein
MAGTREIPKLCRSRPEEEFSRHPELVGPRVGWSALRETLAECTRCRDITASRKPQGRGSRGACWRKLASRARSWLVGPAGSSQRSSSTSSTLLVRIPSRRSACTRSPRRLSRERRGRIARLARGSPGVVAGWASGAPASEAGCGRNRRLGSLAEVVGGAGDGPACVSSPAGGSSGRGWRLGGIVRGRRCRRSRSALSPSSCGSATGLLHGLRQRPKLPRRPHELSAGLRLQGDRGAA